VADAPSSESPAEEPASPASPADDGLPTGVEPAAETAAMPPKPRRYVREYLETILVAILIVLFGTTFIVQNSVIPSASMEQTLLIGDYLLVDRIVFAPADAEAPAAWLGQRELRHGDVIVFQYPPDPSLDYIKRVVGLPGDTIEIRDKQVFRNRSAISEDYKVHAHGAILEAPDSSSPWGGRDNFGPVTVPEGHYFVMGDNRDYSADSREWRFVPRSHVTGRALVVFWSRDMRAGEWERRSRTRITNIFQSLKDFPRLTRWERIGRVVE
jgi:signal peptidase I